MLWISIGSNILLEQTISGFDLIFWNTIILDEFRSFFKYIQLETRNGDF